jgi:hypothetical protein
MKILAKKTRFCAFAVQRSNLLTHQRELAICDNRFFKRE